MAHVGQERALVLARFRQLGVGDLELVDEVQTVQRRSDPHCVLAKAVQFLGTEGGREATGQDHQAATAALHRDRHAHCHPGDAANPDGRELQGDSARQVGDLADVLLGEVEEGQDCAVGLEEDARLGSHQPGGPAQDSACELSPVVGAEQDAVDRLARGLLFRRPPGPSQPGRRREADVEQADDDEGDELGRDPAGRRRNYPACGQRHDDQGDEPSEAEAERPQAHPLYGGQDTRDLPEAHDGLANRHGPHQQRTEQGRKTDRGAGRTEERDRGQGDRR